MESFQRGSLSKEGLLKESFQKDILILPHRPCHSRRICLAKQRRGSCRIHDYAVLRSPGLW
jgi:hypothetical protein